MTDLEKLQATCDFWQRTSLDQQELKNKAIAVVQEWRGNYETLLTDYKRIVKECEELKKDLVTAAEWQHLMTCKNVALQDEVDNGPRVRFKMDAAGNLTRVADLGREDDK